MAKRLVVSHTQLELFEECARRYQYVYRLGLEKRVGVAAIFSRELVHKPLASLYRDEPLDWTALWDAYAEKYGLDALAGPPYTLAVAQACYEQYAERFLESDRAQYAFQPPEQMRFLTVKAHLPSGEEQEVLYLSVPDVVLVDRQTGEATPLDFKTSKRPSPVLPTPLNRQFVGQAMAVGACRYIVAVFTLGATKSGRPHVELVRHEVELTEDLMEEWQAEMTSSVLEIAQADRTGVWRKQAPKACWSYGERCAYINLCEAGALRHGMIENWPKQPPRREDD